MLRPLNGLQKAELARVAQVFQGAYEGSPAQRYVEGERGIGPRTAQAHRLGYVPEGVEGWDRFAGRVAIPYLNLNKEVIHFKFRALDDAHVKYAQQKGNGESRLFNLQALGAASDTLVLCEGEFDVITLTHLHLPAVGIPGAYKFAKHWPRALQGWNRVILFYDDDEAGQKLVDRVMPNMPDVIPLTAPHGAKDLNEAFQAGHGEAIRAVALGLERERDEYNEHGGGSESQPSHGEDAEGPQAEPDQGTVDHDGTDGRPDGGNRGFDGISNPDGPVPF